MDGMIMVGLSALGTIVGIAVGITSFKRQAQKDGTQEGIISSDITYIKNSIDEVKLKLEESDKRYLDIVERLVVLETQCSLHRRGGNTI